MSWIEDIKKAINYIENTLFGKIYAENMANHVNYLVNHLQKMFLIATEIPSKNNSTWDRNSIRLLLANTNYIGDVRHHTADEKNGYSTEGLHEAIISQELFDNAQQY